MVYDYVLCIAGQRSEMTVNNRNPPTLGWQHVLVAIQSRLYTLAYKFLLNRNKSLTRDDDLL